MNIAAPTIWRSTCLTAPAFTSRLTAVTTPAPGLRKSLSTAIRLYHDSRLSFQAAVRPRDPIALLKPAHASIHSLLRKSSPYQSCFLSTSQVSHAVYRRSDVTKPSSNDVPTQSPATIRIIFGRSTVDAVKGNRLLRQLQHRRISGTLDTPTTFPPADVDLALAWLRKTFPLDEDAAINARLDREEVQEAASYLPQARKAEPGVLEQQRAVNAAAAAQREVERKRLKAEQEAKRIEAPTSTAVAARQERYEAWVKKYEDKHEAASLSEVPKMTFLERLIPSTILVATIVALCLWFGDQYIPVLRSDRLFPEIPPSIITIGAITLINISIYGLWRFPPCWQAFNKYMIVVPGYPYAASMLGNTFSHQVGKHLFINMVSLWLVGTQLHDDIGRGPFIALYVAAGTLASYASFSVYVATKSWAVASLGASGALAGLITCWLTIHMESGITIPFLPAWLTTWISPSLIMCMIVAGDSYGAQRFFALLKKNPDLAIEAPVDHLSHLAGYLVGIVVGFYMRHVKKERAKEGISADSDVGRLERMVRGGLQGEKKKVNENRGMRYEAGEKSL